MNLHIGNGNVVTVSNTKDDNGTVISDATVTLESLKSLDGVLVTGPTYPVTLAATATAGEYKATLAATIGISPKKDYKAVIKVVTSGGAIGQKTCTWTAKERTC